MVDVHVNNYDVMNKRLAVSVPSNDPKQYYRRQPFLMMNV